MLLKTIKNIDFNNKKILYIPSAGMAQRTLYYYKKGKIWIPVQKKLTAQNSFTIFDEILINTFQILTKIKEGILICCSDVIVLPGEEIKSLESNKVYVFSTDEDMEKGTNHGAFLIDGENVKKIFQKKDIKFLKDNNAISNNKVNIDTGMIFLPDNVVKILNKIKQLDKSIDLYNDIVYLFVKQNAEIKKKIKQNEKDKLEDIGLNVIKMPKGRFIHFGTSKDILNIKHDSKEFFKQLGWNQNFGKYKIQNGSYLENSFSTNSCKDSLIFNSTVNFEIEEGSVMYTAQIGKSKWVTIFYNNIDDVKANFNEATLFGKSLKDIIKDNQNNMWNAKIYIPAKSKELAIENAKKLYNNIKNNKSIDTKSAMSISEILKKEK